MPVERALDLLAVDARLDAERVADADSLHHQHAVVALDLALGLGCESSFSGGDLTRLQRASERAGESAGCGRDEEVERRRALRFAAPLDAVVIGDLVVDAELDRLGQRRQRRPPERSPDPLDADTTRIDDLAHGPRLYRSPRAAAAEAQRGLAAHAWPADAILRVRMGLHTAEPGLAEEGYLGLDVVRAARIAAVAHGGQVLLSPTTHALIAGEDVGDAGARRAR